MVFRVLSVFSGLFLALAAYAQSSPVEGVDYIELKPPQGVESSGKIEVLEFFWYRCPHCYALEPDLESWAKRLPRDVQFKRLPGILNDDWAIDARIFYTLEAIGELERKAASYLAMSTFCLASQSAAHLAKASPRSLTPPCRWMVSNKGRCSRSSSPMASSV